MVAKNEPNRTTFGLTSLHGLNQCTTTHVHRQGCSPPLSPGTTSLPALALPDGVIPSIFLPVVPSALLLSPNITEQLFHPVKDACHRTERSRAFISEIPPNRDSSSEDLRFLRSGPITHGQELAGAVAFLHQPQCHGCRFGMAPLACHSYPLLLLQCICLR